MRNFKTKWFARFARKQRLDDEYLCEAIERATAGLIDADLGGGLVKQRIARPGQGRSSGYRTIIAFRSGIRAVFVYGFAKNELDNIDDRDLANLRRSAEVYMALSDSELDKSVEDKRLTEVVCDD